MDSTYEEASGSLAALLQPRKRDGTDMAVTSAACTPTMSDPGPNVLKGEMDLDETLASAPEHMCKKRKEDDVTREMVRHRKPWTMLCHHHNRSNTS